MRRQAESRKRKGDGEEEEEEEEEEETEAERRDHEAPDTGVRLRLDGGWTEDDGMMG